MEKPAGATANPDPLTVHAAGLTVDFSRTPLGQLLAGLSASGEAEALASRLADASNRLFAGDILNTTERRSAMHVALRDVATPSTPFAEQAQPVFRRICETADAVRSGQHKGATGQRIRSIINIGIGGSDLGPRLVCDALKLPASETSVVSTHFVANIDPDELDDALALCDPESTLVILTSKTFTTLETLANGCVARDWLLTRLTAEQLAGHLFAVTANPANAQSFGVASDNIFPLWDWVGGRYSLWSAVGLSIAIHCGSAAFADLLAGAAAMDEHFRVAPLNENLPALMALLEDHYVNTLDVHSVAVLPYSHRLRLLPDYLQQLCMESNGKSAQHSGERVTQRTCPVVWGCAGTVGQHSFYQLLHQGTELVPVDFILPLSASGSQQGDDRFKQLLANGLAQSKALYEGKPLEQARSESLQQGIDVDEAERLAAHRQVAGGKPNTIIGLPAVNAVSLGALLALYEHKVFALSVLWNINAFDQWGVELGKQLSGPLASELVSGQTDTQLDATSRAWLARVRDAE